MKTKFIATMLLCITCSALLLGGVGCKRRDSSRIKAIGNSVESNGACGSSQIWTQSALKRATELVDTIKRIKSRPGCSKLEDALKHLERIQSLAVSPEQMEYRATRLMLLPREIASLTSFIGGSNWLKTEARGSLLRRMVELKSTETEILVESNLASSLEPEPDGSISVRRAMEGVHARLLSSGVVGLDALSRIFETIGESESCLAGIGEEQNHFLLGSAQLLGAFASADPGVASRVTPIVQKFVKFINGMFEAKVMRNVTDNQLRETITCLIEMVTHSYCSARDSKLLLDRSFSRQQYDPNPDGASSDPNKAFLGIRLMHSHVPAINKWVQQMMQGVLLRNVDNREELIQLMRLPTDLMAYRMDLDQDFNEVMYVLAGDESESSRSITMAKLLSKFGRKMSQARFPRRRAASSANLLNLPNFFDKDGLGYKLPFLLAGLTEAEIPGICTPGHPDASRGVKSIVDLVVMNGPLPSMASFELFRSTVRRNLNAMQDAAVSLGMEYFWRNYPIDSVMIAAQGISGYAVTPIQALRAVETYLLDYIKLANDSNLPDIKSLLPLAVDTYKRVEEILTAHSKLSATATREQATGFARLLYQRLDVLMFNETLIQRRLQPLVEVELNAMMAGRIPGRQSLEADLVAEAQKLSVTDLFARAGLNQGDHQKMVIDLSAAMTTGINSIEALEQAVAFPLEDQLRRISLRARGGRWDADTIREDSYIRSIRDARGVPTTPQSDRFSDRFRRTFTDWVLLVKPRAAISRSLHPDLYPMPPSGGFRGFAEDEFGSFATLWGFLCAQSLSLPGRDRYRQFCSGSSFGFEKTEALPVRSEGQLLLNYDQWWVDRAAGKPSASGWSGEDAICTTYDMQRRWRVYYMSLDPFAVVNH